MYIALQYSHKAIHKYMKYIMVLMCTSFLLLGRKTFLIQTETIYIKIDLYTLTKVLTAVFLFLIGIQLKGMYVNSVVLHKLVKMWSECEVCTKSSNNSKKLYVFIYLFYTLAKLSFNIWLNVLWQHKPPSKVPLCSKRHANVYFLCLSIDVT